MESDAMRILNEHLKDFQPVLPWDYFVQPKNFGIEN